MCLWRAILTLTSVALALLSCAHGPSTHLPAEYKLDAFSVHAVQSRSQFRAGRFAPVFVEIHNSGIGRGEVDIDCTVGTDTVTGSAAAESMRATATVFLLLPRDVTALRSPRGPQRVSCQARVRGSAGARPGGAIAVMRDLVIEPPTLPDFALLPDHALPSGAFDCDNYAPPIATRSTCLALESRNRGATGSDGTASIHCTVDGAPAPISQGPWGSGELSLGRLAVGHHVVRCTTTSPNPEWEADLSNNVCEVAFDVGDDSSWSDDLALIGIDSSAHLTRVHSSPAGPSRDSPLPLVPGIGFIVHVQNAGTMRIFAVGVSCDAGHGEQTTTFRGVWAAPARDQRDWLRGLEPGETAAVEVTTPGSPPTGRQFEVVCEARVVSPRDVPDLNLRNNKQSARVFAP